MVFQVLFPNSSFLVDASDFDIGKLFDALFPFLRVLIFACIIALLPLYY